MDNITSEYNILDTSSVKTFTQRILHTPVIEAVEIGDGNVNQVFRLTRRDGTSVIVKQALPYLRMKGRDWPLTVERASIEARILRIEHELCPAFVPQVYHHDHIMAAIVMEDIRGHALLRQEMMLGHTFTHLGRHLGVFCALTLFKTTDLWLNPIEKKRNVAELMNPEMRALLELALYIDPFMKDNSDRVEAELKNEARAIFLDLNLRSSVAQLLHEYRTSAEAMLHGDLHTGSMLVTPETTKIIDPEFGFYGPIGFDLAMIVAGFTISLHCHRMQGNIPYTQWISDTMNEFWRTFVREIEQMWPSSEYWLKPFITRVLRSMSGHAGVEIVSRVLGMAPVEDIETIPDAATRIATKQSLLSTSKRLILSAQRIDSFQDLWDLVLGRGTAPYRRYYPIDTD